MLNFKVEAIKDKRKDGYNVEVSGKVKGDEKMLIHEIYALLMKLDELENGSLLIEALDHYIKTKVMDICGDCDECEGCKHEDD